MCQRTKAELNRSLAGIASRARGRSRILIPPQKSLSAPISSRALSTVAGAQGNRRPASPAGSAVAQVGGKYVPGSEAPVYEGAWQPHILLSARSVVEKNIAGVRAALAHEWAHIRHGDLWLLALERLMVVDDRACHGSDDRAARLAVVVAVVITIMMMRRRKRTSGRQKEREAQQRRLDFLASHVVYLRPLILRERCR